MFHPVLYKDGKIFYGWSHTPHGYANYGYSYDQFQMPAQNIDLYAICITPYYGPSQTCQSACCDFPCDDYWYYPEDYPWDYWQYYPWDNTHPMP